MLLFPVKVVIFIGKLTKYFIFHLVTVRNKLKLFEIANYQEEKEIIQWMKFTENDGNLLV